MRETEKGSKPGLITSIVQTIKRSKPHKPTTKRTIVGEENHKSNQTTCSTPTSKDAVDDGDRSPCKTSLDSEKQHVSTSSKGLKNGPSTDEMGNTYPEGGPGAWLVTFGCYCGMFAGFGLLNTIGIFNSYISTNQLKAYDESTIAWIFSIFIFLVFFCGLQIGPIFDTRGPRALMIVGGSCVVTSVFLLGVCTEYWHFILSFSILGGFGASLLFTPSIATISHYFHRRRATATGLATTGGSFGGVIFPLMLQRLIPRIGWAWATRVLGFVLLALCIVAVTLTKSRLSAVDRAKAARKQHSTDDNASSTAITVPRTDWRAALPRPSIFLDGTGHVLLTALAIFFLEWGLFIPVTYLPAYALSTGKISEAFSAQLIAIFNAASCFGRYLPGLAADYFGRYNTMSVTVVMCILGVLAFWLPSSLLLLPSPSSSSSSVVGEEIAPMTQTGLITTFAVVFGFASGANISLTPICVGQLCDTREYGLYYATCYTLVSFGSLTGVPIAGALLRVRRRRGGEDGGVAEGGDTGSGVEWWPVVAFTGCCYVAALGCFVWVRVGRVGWGWRKVW